MSCFVCNINNSFHLSYILRGSVWISMKSNLCRFNKEENKYLLWALRAKSILAPLGVPIWIWPTLNQCRMFFVQTSTWLPPRMHQKLIEHGRCCMQHKYIHFQIKLFWSIFTSGPAAPWRERTKNRQGAQRVTNTFRCTRRHRTRARAWILTWFVSFAQKAPNYTCCHHLQSRQCHPAGVARCEPRRRSADKCLDPSHLWGFSHTQGACTWPLFRATGLPSLKTVCAPQSPATIKVVGRASGCVPVWSGSSAGMAGCMSESQLWVASLAPRAYSEWHLDLFNQK